MREQKFEGGSAAEAAIRACEALGLTRRELKYTVAEQSGEGLDRRVSILVEVPAPKPPPPLAPVPGLTSAREGVTSHGAGDFVRSAAAPAPAAHRAPAQQRHGQDAERAGSGAEERPEMRPVRSHSAAARPRPDRGPERAPDRNSDRNFDRNSDRNLDRSPERLGDRPTGRPAREFDAGWRREEEAPLPRQPAAGRRERPASPPSPAWSPEAPRRPRSSRTHAPAASQSDGAASDPIMRAAAASQKASRPARLAMSPRAERAMSIVAGIVERMRLDLSIQLSQEDPEELWIELFGADQPRIIGRHGEVLLALQFVANRMLDRADDSAEPVNQVLICDAGNYRGRRLEALEALARSLATRAVADHRAVRLSPMSAHDRRVFHLALRDIQGVVTRSEGEGLLRSLLIIPSAASSAHV